MDNPAENNLELQKLRESFRKETELRDILLENLPCIALILKKGSREIIFSNAAARLLGAVPGKKCYETCAKRSAPCPFCLAPEIWATDTPRKIEVESDGRWYEGSWAPLDTDRYVHYIFDITERKKLEREQLLANLRFKCLVDSNIVGFVVADMQGGIREANDYYLNLLGFTREELDQGKVKWIEMTPPEWLPADEKAIAELRERGVCTPYEKEYLRKDGSRVNVFLYDAILPGSEGLILAVVLDISDRKRFEKKILESERSLREAERISKTGSWEYDVAKDTAVWSENMYRIFDVDPLMPKELIFKYFVDNLVHPDDREHVSIVFQNALAGKQPYDLEYRVVHKNGNLRNIHALAEIFRDADGRPTKMIGKVEDITQRKKAENILRDSEKRYRSLFENMLNGLAYCQMLFENGQPQDFIYLEVNKNFESLTGLKNVVGKRVSEVIPGIRESDPELLKIYGRVAQTGIPENFEVYLKSLKMWFSISVYGAGTGYFVAVFDVITERKNILAALQASEERYRQLVQGANSVIIRLKRDGTIVFANDYANKFFGYEKDGLAGKDVYTIIPKTESTGLDLSLLIENILTKPEQYTNNVNENICRDGRRVWLNWNNKLILDDKNEVVEILAVGSDITQRKQVESDLQESERKLREAQKMAQLGYWKWEVSTGKVEWSEEVFNIFHLDPKEFTPQIDSILALSPWPEDSQRDKELIRRAMENREKGFYEQRFIRPDKSIGYYYSTFQGRYDENGNLDFIIGTVVDITERKKADEEIRRLNEELEERVSQRTVQLEAINKELEAFSYSVSHDLRAPLRSIDGFGIALKEEYYNKLDDRGRGYLDRIHNSAIHMAQLIEDLLRLSRISRVVLENQQVDLSALSAEILNELKSNEPEREAEIIVLPGVRVHGDYKLLRVAMDNLLRNAWKFTSKQPHARIEVGMKKQEEGRVFYVRDNGVGFDMQYADKLFGAFQRLHKESEFEGTGIGLAIVKRIINRHFGKIWAESKPGEGASFYFTLSGE